jgi:hypothetical protein
MNESSDGAATVFAELEGVVARMEKLQRRIRASGQPASMFEIGRLKDLGREYARLIARLEVVGTTGQESRD